MSSDYATGWKNFREKSPGPRRVSAITLRALRDGARATIAGFVAAGVPVAAICGATFGLARAGLLDDRLHTGNDPSWLASSGYGGAAHFVQGPAVDDRGVITASMTGPLEFARLILARLGIFSTRAREAWYGLHKTGDPACYVELMEALGHGHDA